MISVKYGKEYRLKATDGKKKDELVYVGPLFSYQDTLEAHQSKRVKFLILSVLSIVLFISSLSFYSNLSRVWFVSVPYAFLAMVLFMYVESLCFYWKFRDPLTREQKEKGGDRFKTLSVVYLFIALFSLISSIVTFFNQNLIGYIGFSDYTFFALILVQILVMLYSFKVANQILYKERENPAAKAFED